MDLNFKTLEAYARWYKQLCLYVIPYGEDGSWNTWKYVKQSDYDIKFSDYNWNTSKGICALIGKKGIRALHKRNIKNKAEQDEWIKDTLDFLGLPENYPWVILYPGTVTILIETQDINGMCNTFYSDGTYLLWQTTFPLPAYPAVTFYKDNIPLSRPAHIDITVLEKLISLLKDPDTKSLGINKNVWNDDIQSSMEKYDSFKELLKIKEEIDTTLPDYNSIIRNCLPIGAIVWVIIGIVYLYAFNTFGEAFSYWLLTGLFTVICFVAWCYLSKKYYIYEYINSHTDNEIVRILKSIM